ncbi:MAG: peptidyl-prolyl cis-trans isomerase [Alistipes sp.]|nr:peptidyl-prolyl cis-trans isomerase [Alistipes sp.]
MRRLIHILAFVALLATVSCRELPDYLVGDDTVARVGRDELTIHEIAEAVPANLTGNDSLSFAKQYVDRWIIRQLKVEEADRLFSGSEKDIERMVEEYRTSLLNSRVDQYYVDQQGAGDFTDEDIAEYYNTHKSDFTLDRTLVKGRIVAFSDSYRQAKRLKEQMQKAATSATDDKTFADTCEKNGFQYIDNRSGWINFADFLSNLPTTRTQDYEPLLDKMGIQEMEANGTRYYFDFSSVCRRGDVAPLEVVADNIRRILVTQRRSAIIRSHEESIVDQAEQQGHARIYKPVAQPQQEE